MNNKWTETCYFCHESDKIFCWVNDMKWSCWKCYMEGKRFLGGVRCNRPTPYHRNMAHKYCNGNFRYFMCINNKHDQCRYFCDQCHNNYN